MSSFQLFAGTAESYNAAEKESMLDLARATLNSMVTGSAANAGEDLLPRLSEKKGCFITLTKGGVLRGCVGQVVAELPLYRAIVRNVEQAASQDSRFPPVEAAEVKQLRIEISVLTAPQQVQFSSPEELLGKLSEHADGVLLQIGERVATFLPQVWQQLPGKEDFLGRLAQKAGCQAFAWRRAGTTISIYRAETFAEAEPGLEINRQS